LLLVDDEPRIRRVLRLALEDEGYDVAEAANGYDALAALRREPPDVVLLDLMLPDRDGFTVCREIRRSSDVPVIMVTARTDSHDVVAGLEAGADDYVTKPVGPRELVARLQAALRRADPGVSEPVLRAENLELDLAAHVVRVDGEEVHLTPIEFKLLRALAVNRGRLMTHRALLVEVWGPEYADDVQVLRVHIANLRRKLGAPAYLRTDPGVGYRFAA
jgi:two-component system KDP operon response regulator KdpE